AAATAATGTVSAAISRNTSVSTPAMPRLVSQRRAFETLSRRFGRMSSIAAMRRNTAANAASLINPSLWPRRPSMREDSRKRRAFRSVDGLAGEAQADHAEHHQPERGELDEGERLPEIGETDHR